MLKELREKNNMSQQELAQAMSVTQSLVSKWERGEVLPRAGKLLKLCEIFNCTLDELMKGGNDNEA